LYCAWWYKYTASFIFFQVRQVSSAIVCEENQGAYGLLGSLGLDNLTTQAFGFAVIVISLAYYNFLYQDQNKPKRIEIEPSSMKDVAPLDTGGGQ